MSLHEVDTRQAQGFLRKPANSLQMCACHIAFQGNSISAAIELEYLELLEVVDDPDTLI